MKMLKSKNIRRICVLFAMLAPVVYLFGSLFSALTGAHGTEVFAEPVYEEQYIDVDDFGGYGSYRLTVESVEDLLKSDNFRSVNYTVPFVYDGSDFDSFRFFVYNGLRIFQAHGVTGSPSRELASYSLDNGTLSEPYKPWSFFGSSAMGEFVNFIDSFGVSYSLAMLSYVPTAEIPENAGAYSDYVFKNFFSKDNFLEQIGKDVLSDNPHGFVPFASFWKYLDNNMLHMGDMQLGLMGYGYVYYCCHVLLFDIAFILVTFFLDFIQKVNDKVVGGVD